MSTTTPSSRHSPLASPMAGSTRGGSTPLAELFVGFFRRDLQGFFPQSRFEPLMNPATTTAAGGPIFRFFDAPGDGDDDGDATTSDEVEIFGARFAIGPRGAGRFSSMDRRLVRAIGAVLSLRHHHVFRSGHAPRLELFQGGSDDHYVAAFVEPSAYALPSSRPSRIAATIHTLRTAALSTYENRRVSTGALLLGPGDDPVHPARPTPPDALTYGVELTVLRSLHRLCDGRRTLFLVDPEGKLSAIIDIARWAGVEAAADEVPCARAYAPHARATRAGGHVCVVLSPNQEIKLFADGVQAFAFSHGRWRVLDPRAKYDVWRRAVAHDDVARVLFQTALDLAEDRQGGLFVVVNDPCQAVGRLVAPHDVLGIDAAPPCEPPSEFAPGDPLAKRALHYLARGQTVVDLDRPVLEALAGVDGATVTDRAGRVLAFGAILRHDPSQLTSQITAEGARTTAALVASRFGPVLKISEDGLVSCYLDGVRVWDL